MIFKLKTIMRRFLVQLLHLNRPTSYPFISGDGFRSLAQHIYDDLSDIKPELVEESDIIFVRSDFLKEFFEKKHPLIKHKYILISHNVDLGIDKEFEKYIDDKIIHWFAQNVLLKHEKLTPIPIGVTNYHYTNSINRGKISDLLKYIRIKNQAKKIENKISFGFSYSEKYQKPEGLLDRFILGGKLEKNKNFDRIKTKTQPEFYEKLSQYYFTVSPEGAGIDCYRTWESFCLGVAPIVKRRVMTEYYKSIGLPVLIIDEWSEMDTLLKSGLSNKYDELKSGFNNPAIYMSYWIDLIISKKLNS